MGCCRQLFLAARSQAETANHKYRSYQCKHRKVGSGIHPEEAMRPEFAKAETIKPNHVEKWDCYDGIENAIERAGIAGFRSHDLHNQSGTSSPAEAFGNQIECRAR